MTCCSADRAGSGSDWRNWCSPAPSETAYGIWDELIARAVTLPASALDERVDEEWSFAETVRHLIYATDAWFRHAVLDLPSPYHSIAVSHDEARGHDPGIDLDASPSFDEVLAVRRENCLAVREFAARLNDADLDTVHEPSASSGHPYGSFSVRTVFWVILNEEYWHSTYASRDLDTLTSR